MTRTPGHAHRAARAALLTASALVLISCEKEVEVDLPETEAKLVVEGTIEQGQPPIVILTRTQSYFAPTDLNSIAGIFVKDAVITVSDGTSFSTARGSRSRGSP